MTWHAARAIHSPGRWYDKPARAGSGVCVCVIPARVPQPDGRPHGGCSPRACCKCYWCAYAGCAGTPCRRNKAAAKKFFAQGAPELLKGCTYVPRVLITDKLASYGAAKREVLTSVEHRQSRYLNNRAENSHQPTRRRERGYPLWVLQRFKSAGHAQRFARRAPAAFGLIREHFCPRRHRLKAQEYRAQRQARFQVWNEVTSVQAAA
jgi:hypothetical protein